MLNVIFKGWVMALLVITQPFVYAEEMTIDFSESQSFPTSSNTVQINHIRLDTKIVNPFDPTRPQIATMYADVPFHFDMASLHLIPMLSQAVVDDNNKCATLDVLVNNAYDGQVVSGATVLVGTISKTTDSNGKVSFANLVKGAVSVEVTAPSFRPNTPRAVDLVCGSQNVSVSLSPTEGTGALTANQVRVILNWGENPQDIDAHLTGPSPGLASSNINEADRFHIFWYNKDSSDGVGVLDVDDLHSYGPETVTISPPTGQSTLRAGVYRYSVHHYDDSYISGTASSGTLSDNTTVELIVGTNSRVFKAPAGAKAPLDVWTVFELSVDANGHISILPVNTYTSGVANKNVRSGSSVAPQQEPSALYFMKK
jgi:uncharacterized protein YfaP (DUF2135 family)